MGFWTEASRAGLCSWMQTCSSQLLQKLCQQWDVKTQTDGLSHKFTVCVRDRERWRERGMERERDRERWRERGMEGERDRERWRERGMEGERDRWIGRASGGARRMCQG